MLTYIRGYGDFDGQQTFTEAGLQFEFTHPLAQLIGKGSASVNRWTHKKRRCFEKINGASDKEKCHCFYFFGLRSTA